MTFVVQRRQQKCAIVRLSHHPEPLDGPTDLQHIIHHQSSIVVVVVVDFYKCHQPAFRASLFVHHQGGCDESTIV